MKAFETFQFFACPLAHNADSAHTFVCTVRSETYKGQFLVVLGSLIGSRQTVNLIVVATFVFDGFVIVQLVKRAVLQTVFVLFHFRRFQDRRQGVTEVHRAVELPPVRQGCRIFILRCCCVLRGFVTLSVTDVIESSVPPPCLFLKPSNRKFPCVESFVFVTPLHK